MYNLVTYPEESLRMVCTECTESDLGLIKDTHKPMVHIMRAYNGIGLAAPQIGINKRFFLIATNTTAPKATKFEETLMIINPEIVETSEEVREENEGCLSLPSFSEPIIRPIQITVKFRNDKWEEVTAVFYGLEARCVLHELDHLNGVLQLDKLSPMRQEMYKKKLRKNRKYGKVAI